MSTRPPAALGVDFGTSYTAASLRTGDRTEDVRIDGEARFPSVVLVADDGTVEVGRRALNRAEQRPERLLRPKALVGRRHLRLGGQRVEVADCIAAILARVREATTRQLGGELPARVVLTHPAAWEEARRAVLEDAAARAGLSGVELVPEPVAAARALAEDRVPQGARLAVYDLGGGTFDVAVLEHTPKGYATVATGGDESIGGEGFTDLLYERLVADRVGRPEGAVAAEMKQRTREAKHELSDYANAEIAVRPFLETEPLKVTRAEFEALIHDQIATTVDDLESVLRDAGASVGELYGLYLSGDSSRIPLVDRLIGERLGRMPQPARDPKLVVAQGATLEEARAAEAEARAPEPERVVPAEPEDPPEESVEKPEEGGSWFDEHRRAEEARRHPRRSTSLDFATEPLADSDHFVKENLQGDFDPGDLAPAYGAAPVRGWRERVQRLGGGPANNWYFAVTQDKAADRPSRLIIARAPTGEAGALRGEFDVWYGIALSEIGEVRMRPGPGLPGPTAFFSIFVRDGQDPATITDVTQNSRAFAEAMEKGGVRVVRSDDAQGPVDDTPPPAPDPAHSLDRARVILATARLADPGHVVKQGAQGFCMPAGLDPSYGAAATPSTRDVWESDWRAQNWFFALTQDETAARPSRLVFGRAPLGTESAGQGEYDVVYRLELAEIAEARATELEDESSTLQVINLYLDSTADGPVLSIAGADGIAFAAALEQAGVRVVRV